VFDGAQVDLDARRSHAAAFEGGHVTGVLNGRMARGLESDSEEAPGSCRPGGRDQREVPTKKWWTSSVRAARALAAAGMGAVWL
jgi:hypothetical protein